MPEPSPIELASERLAIVREHPLGQTLLQRPRYGHFRPDDISIPEWLDLFDSDVNNFEHNGLTACIGDWIADVENLDPALRSDLVMTLSIHDLPEDVTGDESGDPQYNVSGDSHQDREHARLRELANDPTFPLTRDEVDRATAHLKDSKKQPPETGAGWWINIAERIGYLRTALIAFDNIRQPDLVKPEHRINLQWMIANILGNHLAYMVEASKESTAVRLQLENAQFAIDAMVSMISSEETQIAIYGLCKVTGQPEARVNPDDELRRINRAIETWSATQPAYMRA